MGNPRINEYIHVNGIDSAGAVAGTEFDSVLAADPNYALVGKSRPAAAETSGEEGEAGEGGSKSEPTDPTDLKTLNREQLNTLAAERGIEGAEDLPNKGAVIEAIQAAETSGEEG